MALSCSLEITHFVTQETGLLFPYNKSFIDQACSVKTAGYWPRSFFACLSTSTPSRSDKYALSRKKNLADIYSHLDLTFGQ